MADDPAMVLEDWIQQESNLAEELAHLSEEMEAKQREIDKMNHIIVKKEEKGQNFVKHNGALVKDPHEDTNRKVIIGCYDQIDSLLEEKIKLNDKRCTLLDREVKKLDKSINEITKQSQAPAVFKDLPNLITQKNLNVAPASATTTGYNTPLGPLSNHTSSNRTNMGLQLQQALAHGMVPPNAQQVLAMQQMRNLRLTQSMLSTNTPSNLSRQAREMSATSDSKRRRPNKSLGPMPPPSTGPRQSSLGPSTPKVNTPSGSRQGSVGPRLANKPVANKKVAPHHQHQQSLRKSLHKTSKKRRSMLASGNRASPSTTNGSEDEESAISDASRSESEDRSIIGRDGGNEEEGMDDEDADDTLYCFCNKPSYGNMVACDNVLCKHQWFHWTCVGLTQEPRGEWLCSECAALPKSKIKKAAN
ncbi:hypothetical protein K402DRAFT_324805 [Aulographum hederae CBS 113979]|uniref:Chromatin modification-related protein n=1 Tax=Aulographum hederae CBS 113979 TaxID=1176131 RepID=A0A6G1HAI7_9PEZI|nr:hypothetical protein K402DRAFT_324805 [Aulographum hederae CBS 113979]